MYRFWSFFIKNKRFSQLILFALILFGTLSVISIPKESTPEVEIPIGIVSTFLPGGSAEDVEQLITDEIESGLTNLKNVKNITSSSGEGVSSVVVEFEASANIDDSIKKLKDAVDAIKYKLPIEAEDPSVIQVDFSSEPIMIISVATDRAATENILLADTVERELEKVKGVSDVIAQGLRKREVQVVVNSEALDRFGITLVEVTNAIRNANTNLPIGSISFDNTTYNVSFDADIKSPDEVENIVITEKNGLPIYVRDIAFISVGVEKISNLSRVSVGGSPSEQAMSFSVLKQSGGDITETTALIREVLAKMQDGGILEGSNVLISYDIGEFITKDLSNLTLTALQTIILVMIILFLAIGLKEALIAGISIPISFLIAFIGLSISGNTINFVSLFSLILAVGILVDSAIVIIEGMHSNIEATNGDGSKSVISVALQTLKEFHSPLFSGTLTTIAVFAPLFFISGITGEFISSIPFTMIFVLAASIVVALGFLPVIASSFIKKEEKHDKWDDKRSYYLTKIELWYKSILLKILGNRKRERLVIKWSIIGFFIALLLPMTGIVKVIFFPQEDVDFVFIEVETKGGTILEQTDLATRQVEEILYDTQYVESFVTTVGSGSSFSGNIGGGSSSGGSIANITVNLNKNRKKSSTEISDIIRAQTSLIKSADVRVLQTNSGPPSGAPVLIKFFGDDLNTLEQVASKGENILKQIDGTIDVETSTKDDGIEFVISVDRDKASELGVSVPIVAQTLRTAIHGATATTIKKGGEDIDVVVLMNLNPNYQDPYDSQDTTIDTVRQIEIPTPRGTVLIGSFVDVSLKKGSSVIRHEDSKRITTLSSEIEDGTTAATIIGKFTDVIEKEKIVPEDIIMKIGGETEDVNQSFKEMGFAFIAGILLMLAILVLQFGSLRYAGFILVIIPLSMIGIFAGLALTRQPLSFPSLMGIIALSGILVNNSIILIDKMNSLRENSPEKSMREVVVESGVSRLRPILLTTITTVIGIIPLTYAGGLWAPLAWSIIFGLSFSVVLTLVLIPIMYDRWHKR